MQVIAAPSTQSPQARAAQDFKEMSDNAINGGNHLSSTKCEAGAAVACGVVAGKERPGQQASRLRDNRQSSTSPPSRGRRPQASINGTQESRRASRKSLAGGDDGRRVGEGRGCVPATRHVSTVKKRQVAAEGLDSGDVESNDLAAGMGLVEEDSLLSSGIGHVLHEPTMDYVGGANEDGRSNAIVNVESMAEKAGNERKGTNNPEDGITNNASKTINDAKAAGLS